MAKNKKKSNFKDWLRTNMLKPVVIGDEAFAFKLRSFIGADESFTCFDAEALMSATYSANCVALVGPVNEAILERYNELKREGEVKTLYIEEVFSERHIEEALKTADSLGATKRLIKEFVEPRDVVKALKELANV